MKLIKTCKFCGEFYHIYSGIQEQRSKYCSRICKDKDMVGKILNKSNTNRGGRPKGRTLISKLCKECGVYFDSYASHNRKYCSNKCSHKPAKRGDYSINLGKTPWNKHKKGLQKHSDDTKNKQRTSRLNYMESHKGNFKNTDIEIIMKLKLKDENISFVHSKRIGKFCVDFLIKDIIVECDGEYWHNRPGDKAKDFIRDNYLINKGYTVLRFSEYNIKNNIKTCINFLKSKL